MNGGPGADGLPELHAGAARDPGVNESKRAYIIVSIRMHSYRLEYNKRRRKRTKRTI